MKSVIALTLTIALVAASPVLHKPSDISGASSAQLSPVDVADGGVSPALKRKARQYFGGSASNVDVFTQHNGYGVGGFGPFGGFGGFGGFGPFGIGYGGYGGGYGNGYQNTDVAVNVNQGGYGGYGGFGPFGWGR